MPIITIIYGDSKLELKINAEFHIEINETNLNTISIDYWDEQNQEGQSYDLNLNGKMPNM